MSTKTKKPQAGDTDCLDMPSKGSPRAYGNGKPIKPSATASTVELPAIDPKLHPDEGTYLQAVARSLTLECVMTLVDIMRNGRNDVARGTASRELLDRGWGKAHVHIDEPTATHTNIQVIFGDKKKPDGGDPA